MCRNDSKRKHSVIGGAIKYLLLLFAFMFVGVVANNEKVSADWWNNDTANMSFEYQDSTGFTVERPTNGINFYMNQNAIAASITIKVTDECWAAWDDLHDVKKVWVVWTHDSSWGGGTSDSGGVTLSSEPTSALVTIVFYDGRYLKKSSPATQSYNTSNSLVYTALGASTFGKTSGEGTLYATYYNSGGCLFFFDMNYDTSAGKPNGVLGIRAKNANDNYAHRIYGFNISTPMGRYKRDGSYKDGSDVIVTNSKLTRTDKSDVTIASKDSDRAYYVESTFSLKTSFYIDTNYENSYGLTYYFMATDTKDGINVNMGYHSLNKVYPFITGSTIDPSQVGILGALHQGHININQNSTGAVSSSAQINLLLTQTHASAPKEGETKHYFIIVRDSWGHCSQVHVATLTRDTTQPTVTLKHIDAFTNDGYVDFEFQYEDATPLSTIYIYFKNKSAQCDCAP